MAEFEKTVSFAHFLAALCKEKDKAGKELDVFIFL